TTSAGGVDYQQFILPGVMAMSVLFSSLFSAISIVWDREFGFLREMLVAPVSRAGLVPGKAAGSGTGAAGQGLILLIAAPIVGVHLDALQIIEVIPLLMLLAFALTAFGIVIASRMQRMESFQMVMGLGGNPMLSLSGAIFPLAGLATWLAVVTRLNPATYGIDPIRRVMLGESDAAPLTINGWVVPIWTEVLIVLTLGIAMLALAVRSFQKTEERERLLTRATAPTSPSSSQSRGSPGTCPAARASWRRARPPRPLVRSSNRLADGRSPRTGPASTGRG